ncbi:hypothetical protein BD779DRAFT_1453034 [Infundibulicybe gibba]|nr:hypothetical protein BD779DRAFT_1453034 [Infundibulicybe gibba]
MLRTPPHHISIHRPPPSPTPHIRVSPEDDFAQAIPVLLYPGAPPVVTPKRKARQDIKPRRKKRKLVQARELTPFEEVVINTADNAPTPQLENTGEGNTEAIGSNDTAENALTSQLGDVGKGDTEGTGSDEEYERFVKSVLADECAMYQLSDSLFIVSGWDQRSNMSMASWYHLQMTNIGVELVVMCLCPQTRVGDNTDCFHVRHVARNKINDCLERNDLPILFSRQRALQDLDENKANYINHFSAPTLGKRSLSGHVVVSFEGTDSGDGIWTCNKESAKNCVHIKTCRHALQRYIHVDVEARDNSVGEDDPLIYEPVSYLTIPPPRWAAINSDPDFGRPSTPLGEPPALIHLTGTSTCCCSIPRCRYNPLAPIRQQQCIIYSMTHSFTSIVEIQTCQLCNRRFIGPDCQELGIFNFNNRIMFTHDVLDDYTSKF